jgi:hypothetical protein
MVLAVATSSDRLIEWLPGLVDSMRVDPRLGARNLDGAECREQNQLPTEPVRCIARLGDRLLTGVEESHNMNLPRSPASRVPECVDA